MDLRVALPNFARACGRVSVGGHPDKRPDSRPHLPNVWGGAIINRQPEAKTGAPRFPRGTRLKATTERAFLVSICPPKADSPKRLVHLARRADGIPPIQSTAAHTGLPDPILAFPPRRHRGTVNPGPHPNDAGRRKIVEGGSCHDRTHP